MRMTILRLAALAIVAVAALPSQASAALTASDVRIGAQPAFVRVVVDVTGGPAEFNETDATDHVVADGSGRVDISHPGIVVDLYRSRAPGPAAEIRTGVDGCLTLASVQTTGHTFRLRGTARNLFEANFVIRVRDGLGRVLGRRIVTANGPWNQTVSYPVGTSRQAGTVEAVAESAKDGSLVCIVQRRVRLVP